MRATGPAHFIFLNLITIIIFVGPEICCSDLRYKQFFPHLSSDYRPQMFFILGRSLCSVPYDTSYNSIRQILCLYYTMPVVCLDCLKQYPRFVAFIIVHTGVITKTCVWTGVTETRNGSTGTECHGTLFESWIQQRF
jgi:hypothetical protein